MVYKKIKSMTENQNDNIEPENRNAYAVLYDVVHALGTQTDGFAQLQKELIKLDPSVDKDFKQDGYPIDIYKEINKYSYQQNFDWLQFFFTIYSYYFQRKRTKDLLFQASEIEKSLTTIDAKINNLGRTLGTLEAEIKANTTAIAALDKDLTAKMTKNVGIINQNTNDDTTKIIKAIP